MNTKKSQRFLVTLLIVIQTIIFVFIAQSKDYIHMDEAYSLGLASYDKVEIQDNEDFYNNWHTKEYYQDYLAVQDDESWTFSQVYENQKNDVHPPFYYLLLRIFMEFDNSSFAKWSGIILNMIVFAFITVFTYLILKIILKDTKYHKLTSALIAFVSSITIASLTNVIYIRMYALTTLLVVITAYLHILLLDKDKISITLFTLIGITSLVGSLTHYYYLFFLFGIFICFAIKYVKNKKYKQLGLYIATMIIAGGVSLIIFPHSINHIFFGYRGQGFLEKLTDFDGFLANLMNYVHILHKYAFNHIFYGLIAYVVVLRIYAKIRKIDINIKGVKYLYMLIFPLVFYFIPVAIASPWLELRYLLPISSLLFALLITYTLQLTKCVFKVSVQKIVAIVLIVLFVFTPIIFKSEPTIMYSQRENIVNTVKNDLNVPALYFLNTNNNRFLDDILLFSIIDYSYIAKNSNFDIEEINGIYNNIDLSNGTLVFIQYIDNSDYVINQVKQATGLESHKHIDNLNVIQAVYIY